MNKEKRPLLAQEALNMGCNDTTLNANKLYHYGPIISSLSGIFMPIFKKGGAIYG